MKFLNFFLLLWVIFALLDRDTGFTYGSGSTDLIESGSNRDPDPQPWFKLKGKSSSLKKEHLALKNLNFPHFCGSFWAIRIRIPNADPDPADQNECGSGSATQSMYLLLR
jgi:hypothetical protein